MRELCYVLQLGIVDRMKILKNRELIDGKHFLFNGIAFYQMKFKKLFTLGLF